MPKKKTYIAHRPKPTELAQRIWVALYGSGRGLIERIKADFRGVR